jgi:hypothetical protein
MMAGNNKNNEDNFVGAIGYDSTYYDELRGF